LNDDLLRTLLGKALDKSFGPAARHIKAMKVRLVFKGVTIESLTDPSFIELARERLPGLNALHHETSVAPSKST